MQIVSILLSILATSAVVSSLIIPRQYSSSAPRQGQSGRDDATRRMREILDPRVSRPGNGGDRSGQTDPRAAAAPGPRSHCRDVRSRDCV
ncbi:hypothetical protein DFH28DRAFT_1104353 [Melampsora americana]|nr:hypothetical protein DFH28DRAFT_1104353 [Melampsora americana]